MSDFLRGVLDEFTDVKTSTMIVLTKASNLLIRRRALDYCHLFYFQFHAIESDNLDIR